MSGAMPAPVAGVYLSDPFDLAALFAPHAELFGARIRLLRPQEVTRPEEIRFALAWQPGREAFRPYPNLRLVSSIAAGVDSLLACPSLPADAVVTRVRDDDQATFMAGFAAWHVVWHHRRMARTLRNAATGAWNRTLTTELDPPRAVTVGVLGYGLMGKAVARAVAALGYRVLAAARSARHEPAADGVTLVTGADAIGEVAARSNVLVNVLPLTPATENVLDAALFARMPRGAALVQLGRGQHLVDDDPDRALDGGRLAGASLDVFRTEPLPPDHRWWRDPRILVTPHQACDSSPARLMEQLVQSLDDTLAGRRPRNAVDRQGGY